jgi:hypothetical protein
MSPSFHDAFQRADAYRRQAREAERRARLAGTKTVRLLRATEFAIARTRQLLAERAGTHVSSAPPELPASTGPSPALDEHLLPGDLREAPRSARQVMCELRPTAGSARAVLAKQMSTPP